MGHFLWPWVCVPLLEGRIRLSFLSPADLGLDGLIDNLWCL